MTMPKATLLFLLATVACQSAVAKISAINHTGEGIRLTFHGAGCRYHDSTGYAYPPCAEHQISPNATVVFSEIISADAKLTKREKIISPRIVFSTLLGFSYGCKLVAFSTLRVCQLHESLFEATQACAPTDPVEAEKPEDENNRLQFIADQHYALEIGSDWWLYPTPRLACKVTQIKEDPAICAQH